MVKVAHEKNPGRILRTAITTELSAVLVLGTLFNFYILANQIT